jgi:SAM-dependent methyltransferase
MKTKALRPYGHALRDYFAGDESAVITMQTSLGEYDALPISIFFREPQHFLPFEGVALDHCRGRVLDAGAGTGVHALELQKKDFDVTAVDILPEAVEIMKERGVRDARLGDMFNVDNGERFDTILMLMNGTGPMGTLDGLDAFLERAPRLLNRGGRVILDSSEVELQELPQGAPDPDWPKEPSVYVGESWIRLEYRGNRGEPFRELYIDHSTLEGHAQRAGWRCDVIFLDEHGAFTALLHPPR